MASVGSIDLGDIRPENFENFGEFTRAVTGRTKEHVKGKLETVSDVDRWHAKRKNRREVMMYILSGGGFDPFGHSPEELAQMVVQRADAIIEHAAATDPPEPVDEPESPPAEEPKRPMCGERHG